MRYSGKTIVVKLASFLLLAACLLPAASVQADVIARIDYPDFALRLTESGSRYHLHLESSSLEPLKGQVFGLKNPPRLVIDLRGESLEPRNIDLDNSQIYGVRLGRHPNKTRIVLDIADGYLPNYDVRASKQRVEVDFQVVRPGKNSNDFAKRAVKPAPRNQSLAKQNIRAHQPQTRPQPQARAEEEALSAAKLTKLKGPREDFRIFLVDQGNRSYRLRIEKLAVGTNNINPIDAEAFALQRPNRLVLDVYGERFKLPETASFERGPFEQIRVGTHSDKTRIVLDLRSGRPPQYRIHSTPRSIDLDFQL